MKKAILIQIISLLLVFVLVGCNAPANPSNESSDISSNTNSNLETDEIVDADASAEDEVEETEIDLNESQKNSIAMLNYLTVTAEEIRVSKNNRLMLKDIHFALINYINGGAVDEDTKAYLQDLRDTIKQFLKLDTQRSQLQYRYNQEKAAKIKNAIPDPLAILSITNSNDWKSLVTSLAYTLVDSYNNYRNAESSAEKEFLLSGWDLDQEEENTILDSQGSWFDYMVTIVNKYGTDEADKLNLGNITLTPETVSNFAKICAEEEPESKLQSLKDAESTYKMYGNYWLQLADSYYTKASKYYETGEQTKAITEYKNCLMCIEKYNELDTGIFTKDFNIVPIMPKVVEAAQKVYSNEEYIPMADNFCKTIMDNVSDSDWSSRYFVALTYMDLFARTGKDNYLKEAYKITLKNVNELKKEQEAVNKQYFNEVDLVEMPSVDDGFLTKEEKESLKKEQKKEKERIDAYNKELQEIRKTELPSLYEPLVLNCDLLFALAEKISINEDDKASVQDILQTKKNGVFLCDPINQKYSFAPTRTNYSVELTKSNIIIPANLLTQDAEITITVTSGSDTTTFDDVQIKKVTREGKIVNTFKAKYTSKLMKDYKWSANAKMKITIDNNYGDPVVLNYKVKKYKDNWIFPDSIAFEKA